MQFGINKGNNRPFNNLSDRVEMLENIKPIDKVLTFSTDEELSNLVENISPDIMMVGEEYKGKNVIGSKFAKELVFFRRIGEYSTTNISKNITSRR